MLLKVFTTTKEEPLERDVIELAKRIEEEGYTVEYFDFDDQQSDAIKAIYDIFKSPALIITQEDGRLIELWQGEMPTESEIKNYLRM